MRYLWAFSSNFILLFILCSLDSILCLTPQEITVLKKISAQQNSYSWNISDSDPCRWNGVLCRGNNVVELNLSGFGFNGNVWPTICQLEGLEKLDVSNNSLATPLSDDINNCRSLVSLNISSNSLSGLLPSITSLSKLQTLDLSNNRLLGAFGPQIHKLTDLRILKLTYNNFTGLIPSSLGDLIVLKELYLSHNNFSGNVPEELTNCINLTFLDLSQNRLNGTIPENIGKLVGLENLILSANHFSGSIPNALGGLHKLKRFAANQNQLTGFIPVQLSSIRGLESVDLSYNNLSGRIPPQVFSLSNLQSLDLTSNSLSGPIPQNFSRKLFRLRIGQNRLDGGIPSTIGNASGLIYLELDDNSLEGQIPQELSKCTSLALLNLGQNNLSGSLSYQLPFLVQLQELKLPDNNFDGTIPEELSNFSKLSYVDLSGNFLSGAIPRKLFQLQQLQFLHLQNNRLTGHVPNNVHECTSLLELQLGHNTLNGKIPIEIGSATRLQVALNLSYNFLEGNIPATLSSLVLLEILDLSNNRLTGQIPESLTHMMSLTQLVLSNNRLTGTLPPFRKTLLINVTGNTELCVKDCNGQHVSHTDTKKKVSAGLLVGVAIAGALIALGAVALSVVACKCFQYERELPEVQESPTIEGHFIHPNSIHRASIDFEKGVEATLDPANLVLKNKFSTYYKAVMPSGTSYSVKKLNWTDKIFKSGSYRKLGVDLEKQGRLSHPNIMTPLAYVLQTDCALLFYEYVHKGSLSEFLHSSNAFVLDWPSRCSIAVGVAEGLSFLHGCQEPILHLDLSTKNILLKSLSEPQIGDIELCKIVDPCKSTGSLSTVAGSIGYIPPEYAYMMRVTVAGNVYSFGVVMLELLTGRPPISRGMDLAKWVQSTLSQDETWDQILDARIRNSSLQIQNEMLSMLKIALSCVSSSPNARPKMRTVVEMLQAVRQTS